ncbi:hypothetical protein PLESTB_000464600 [Pleodorina starrii]|uniref:Galactokinase n=1 Tax=Pleodorina starrii TaxID=330485 RepID=A0A9W6EZT1_9CHLO|nr:hypothetical protein PLESTM_000799100 [Pleodorina starrii]GLC51087.1 hypothetical protein PLESTB_000464600 [Pleodorina starrii]GLC63445.1 hypothetical protein PLESTF_000037100 [Pleodorina starrii]
MTVTVQNGRVDRLASLPDTQAFLDSLEQHKLSGTAKELFRWDAPLVVARAPGRLDVMGGIADYSGSLVLQMPISEAAHVALQLQDAGADSLATVQVISIPAPGEEGHRAPSFNCNSADLFPAGQPLAYDAAMAYFKASPATSWAAYIVGCLLVLARNGPDASTLAARLAGSSVRVLVQSRVPEGKGVSSSAAVEVATMTALTGALGVTLEGRQLAILCQRVENLVVGAPCGIMDQMACTLGRQHSLLALLCQPAEVQGTVALPEHVAVWGVDSGIRHSVGGSDYGSVRVGAFMGLRIASSNGKDSDASGAPPAYWGGYLARLAPSQLAQHFAAVLPTSIRGSDFLRRYTTHYDTVTSVDPDKEYAVLQPASHPVQEHFRVSTFRQALQLPAGPAQFELLGELMFQSHASYSGCGLGSDGTDRLVALVREEMDASRARGGSGGPLWGAKITGGGCGGTVCILGEAGPEGEAAVLRVVEAYERERGVEPGAVKVFRGSSPGAADVGPFTLVLS